MRQEEPVKDKEGDELKVEEIFAPCFQVQMLHAIEIDKALINAVAEVGRGLAND